MRTVIDRYLRIDARSLGLFRVAMGLVLLVDLIRRWDWLRAFYSNEGVLPNHNHLFQLRDGGRVWSFLHSFSTVDENHTAFLAFFFIYLFFLVGWKTRAFHVLSLVALVSLVGRNTLLGNVGDSTAIALLAFTAFLPLGARFSVDSLQRSMAKAKESTTDELNARDETTIEAPASLMPLAVVIMVGCIYLFAALQQNGDTWGDGSALYYALHVDRWTDSPGVALRSASPALLAGWTKLLKVAEFAILPLLLLPVARRYVRAGAIGLMVIHGLTFAALFTFGLYGWSLLAAALLMIPRETWDAARTGSRAITVWYDDDCGVCLWAAKLLKRLDIWHNVSFEPNSNSEDYPKDVTTEMTDKSMVVVGPSNVAQTDVLALSEILRSLPLLWPVGWLIRLPGLSHLTRYFYYKVADNRTDISINLGLAACGVPSEALQGEGDDEEDTTTPASVWSARLRTGFVSAAAIALLVVFAAQSERSNALPLSLGTAKLEGMANLASWSRMMAQWGVWAPNPPKKNGRLVTDAKTRDGWEVDVLTGRKPDLDLQKPRLARNGVLWSSYTERIRQDEYSAYRKELRRYLSKGGWAVNTRIPGNYLASFAAYWVSVDTPAPGQAASEEIQRDELFAQRGARSRTTDLPLKRIPRIPRKP
jgi:predicted DCC family thiol-disulfide oxidoreductase YuxK